MNTEALERYLQQKLGIDAEVEGATLAPIGLSRETWFVRLRGGPQVPARLVLRRDTSVGSACPASLRFEYEVYRRLEDTPVPVARTLAYEDDPGWFVDGREFYLREFIDGTTEPERFSDPDPAYDGLRIEAAKEHARRLAAVHTLDWRALGFDDLLAVPGGPADSALVAIDRIQRGLDECSVQPLPLAREAAAWLREHAPRDPPAVCLLKGSNGARQEIFRGTEIVGMSDWELASLGDPASDWGRCGGFLFAVPGRWSERDLLDYYESLTGIAISDERLAYYRVMYSYEMVLVTHHAALPLLRGATLSPGLAYLAGQALHMQLAGLARAIGVGSLRFASLKPPGSTATMPPVATARARG